MPPMSPSDNWSGGGGGGEFVELSEISQKKVEVAREFVAANIVAKWKGHTKAGVSVSKVFITSHIIFAYIVSFFDPTMQK